MTDEWIVRKTGIRERRRADDRDATSDLAARAAARPWNRPGSPRGRGLHRPGDLDPDHPQPATASIVQHLLGAVNAAAFDINAVCSGFVYATAVAERLLRGAASDGYALVIGADIYSRILDYSDRKTAILFGDGAGAVLLGPVPQARGIQETSLLTRGDQYRLISVPAGAAACPRTTARCGTAPTSSAWTGAGYVPSSRTIFPAPCTNSWNRPASAATRYATSFPTRPTA
ncbi:hypothetical protein ACFQ3Z_20630 [Streptomyces nogalater]